MTLRDRFSLESARAARTLVEEVMRVRVGETVLITGDDHGDARVVEVTAQAAYAAGAFPVIVLTGPREEDGVLPPPVGAAGLASDVWIDFAVQGAMYTEAQEAACEAGTRFGDFIEMGIDSLINCIGRVDHRQMTRVGRRLVEVLRPGATVEVSSPNGTRLVATVDEETATNDGEPANSPGAYTAPPGLVTWTAVENSMNGVIVGDGVVWPPHELGALAGEVTLTIEHGHIVAIDGQQEADSLKRWLRELDHPEMSRIAHISHGFHPNVRRFGERVGENERLFGALTFGFGGWRGRSAPAHFDVMLHPPQVRVDDRDLQDGVVFVDEEIKRALAVASGPSEDPS